MAGMPYQMAHSPSYAALRVSNSDREQVVEHVKTAYAEGRLTKEEFDERLDRAMNARTHADLMPIMEDLYGPHAYPVMPYRPPVAAAPYPPRPQAPLTSNDRLGAGAAHLLALLGFPVIAPLILLLAAGKTSPHIRMHAVEALNFQITLVGASILLSITLVGIILLPVIWVAGTVLGIIAGVKAIDGQPYRYPLTVRLVK